MTDGVRTGATHAGTPSSVPPQPAVPLAPGVGIPPPATGRRRASACSPEGFYGWRIVAASSAAVVLTAPGQTAAVSAFIEPMLGELGLSRTALSTAYLVGTLTGAAAMPAVGRALVYRARTSLDGHDPPRAAVAPAELDRPHPDVRVESCGIGPQSAARLVADAPRGTRQTGSMAAPWVARASRATHQT